MPNLSRLFYHDAAAALVVDGNLEFACEEERWTRDKHTNGFPVNAISAALNSADASLSDIDNIAFGFSESFTTERLAGEAFKDPSVELRTATDIYTEHISMLAGRVPPFEFIPHHLAHAASAYFGSGFDDSLILVADGRGELQATSLFLGTAERITEITSFPAAHSLGDFYSFCTEALGFGPFDEYKVMGLSAYGEPAQHAPLLRQALLLRDGGDYSINLDPIRSAFGTPALPRRALDRPVLQIHADFAAAVQRRLEAAVVHILRHWRAVTSSTALCFAGGVAQNSRLNGAIVESGLFTNMFIPPAANDAGAAAGAALYVDRTAGPSRPLSFGRRTRSTAFLAGAAADDATTRHVLDRWREFVTWRGLGEDSETDAATLIANGAILGWCRGNAEFGPRALGHRSILADPRPLASRDRINRAIKKREDFRPFGASVCAEDASLYFDVDPRLHCYDFMSTVVPVRPSAALRLQATTHIDASCRIQFVHKHLDPAFWNLLREFEQITAVPILLNTSFNNYAEPMVHTVEDAIHSFLTSELDGLMLEGLLIRRRERLPWHRLRLTLSAGASITMSEPLGEPRQYTIAKRSRATAVRLTTAAADYLLGGESAVPSETDPLLSEVLALWEARLVVLHPPSILAPLLGPHAP